MTPIEMSTFWFIYRKECYLLVVLEHKAYYAIKNLYLSLDKARSHRIFHEWQEVRKNSYDAYKRFSMILTITSPGILEIWDLRSISLLKF